MKCSYIKLLRQSVLKVKQSFVLNFIVFWSNSICHSISPCKWLFLFWSFTGCLDFTFSQIRKYSLWFLLPQFVYYSPSCLLNPHSALKLCRWNIPKLVASYYCFNHQFYVSSIDLDAVTHLHSQGLVVDIIAWYLLVLFFKLFSSDIIWYRSVYCLFDKVMKSILDHDFISCPDDYG